MKSGRNTTKTRGEQKTSGGSTVTYNNDQATKDAVFEEVLDWFLHNEVFRGKDVMFRFGGPCMLSDVADKILKFEKID